VLVVALFAVMACAIRVKLFIAHAVAIRIVNFPVVGAMQIVVPQTSIVPEKVEVVVEEDLKMI